MNFKPFKEPVSGALWAVTIICLIVTLGAILFVPVPTVASAQLTATRNKKQIQQSVDESNQQIAQMSSTIQKRNWAMDPTKLIPLAMSQVSDAATKSGIQMSSFRPGRNQNLSYVTIVPITITATGKYPQLVGFVRTVEGLPMVNISEVQISESGQDKNTVMATITAVAYTTSNSSGDSNATTKA